ncbi:MAG: protein tyrosine phosphatase [Chthoniobacteraceae bacterium]
MEKNAKKLLFICSRNKIRSLTAEKLMEGIPGYSARSAGTQPGARIVVTQCHIGWADIIFVMEKSHLQKLRQKYPDALEGKEIVTLQIPDEYEVMGEDLIDELKAKLAPYVNFPDGD